MRTRRLALLLAVTLSIHAQEYRATINGLVTDSSGASIPAARVSAINLDTGLVVKSEANAQGRYVIPYLLPGQYKARPSNRVRSSCALPIALR